MAYRSPQHGNLNSWIAGLFPAKTRVIADVFMYCAPAYFDAGKLGKA